ncbi:extracellular solute-binding protein [Streptomyces sp. NPDC051907]|uniref:ABC transporter substrate-binding protein n=1 Tax=Streptomyces sp. NPDC051907 TaxID=3155284 RepID=UPI00343699B3
MSDLSRCGHLAVALAACLGLLSACAPGGEADRSPDSKDSGPLSTDPAQAGKVTLTVWDQNIDPGIDASTERLNEAFMRKYPNVTVKRVSRSFNDLKATIKLALTSGNPPDVIQANQGYPDMGAFVKADLLRPVARYAQVYGWDKAYPRQLLDLNRFSADGRTWKTGELFGVSQTGEIVGVYYNKAKLKALGVAAPTTLSEFEAALGKAKAADELPLAFGNSNKSSAIQLFGVVQAVEAGKQEVRDLVFGQGDARWTGDGLVRSAERLRGWVEKGYLSRGFNGLSAEQAAIDFAEGESAFLVDGTWQAARLAQKMGAGKVGFTALSPTPDASPVTQGGQGLAWAVTSKSAHPDVAAAYIDFLVDEQGMRTVAELGSLPALPPSSHRPAAGTVDADLLAEWREVSERDGLVPYLDYTTPTFYDTLTAALQEMLAGRQPPEKFGRTLEADAAAFRKSR